MLMLMLIPLPIPTLDIRYFNDAAFDAAKLSTIYTTFDAAFDAAKR